MLNDRRKRELLERYGGEEHLQVPELLQKLEGVESSAYVEYSRDGKVLPKRSVDGRRLMKQSKYEEDVLRNGHTAVWGSYWSQHLGWGYKCCYSFDKQSECGGEEAKALGIRMEIEAEKYVKEREEPIESKDQAMRGAPLETEKSPEKRQVERDNGDKRIEDLQAMNSEQTIREETKDNEQPGKERKDLLLSSSSSGSASEEESSSASGSESSSGSSEEESSSSEQESP